jgi:ribosomal protein S18 acetylase RimI-like enzyme
MTRDDSFDDLIALSREFFTEYESYHAELFKIDQIEDEMVVQYFNLMLDKGVVFVALDGSRMIGYITAYVKDQPSCWQVKQVGEISGLMVAPGYRRQGVASRLLAEVEGYFRQKSLRFYSLYTSAHNKTGLAFYEKRGLTPLQVTLIGELEAS